MKRIEAIIQSYALPDVLKALQRINIPGVSITNVKGYGEYINTFAPHDHLESSVKLEIFAPEKETNMIAETIMDITSTGTEGNGIIAISPLDGLYRIRDKCFITEQTNHSPSPDK